LQFIYKLTHNVIEKLKNSCLKSKTTSVGWIEKFQLIIPLICFTDIVYKQEDKRVLFFQNVQTKS